MWKWTRSRVHIKVRDTTAEGLLLSPQMETSRIVSITQWLKGIRLSYNVHSVATNHKGLPRLNLGFINWNQGSNVWPVPTKVGSIFAGIFADWPDSGKTNAQRFLYVQSFLVKDSHWERKRRHDFKSMLKKWGNYFSAKCTMEGECHWRLVKTSKWPCQYCDFL